MSTCTDNTQFVFKDSSDNIPKNAVTVSIHPEVTRIPDELCCGCRSLTAVDIPKSVTIIGKYAFCECSSITYIHIPESVTTIGQNFSCSSITYIHVPESVTTIGQSAFGGCSSLTFIHIPENVASIEDCTFWECSSLTSIYVPKSVTTIGMYAFWECSSLTFIHIPENVTTIEEKAFRGCSSLVSIAIPSSVTEVKDGAFCACHSLEQRQINGHNYHQHIPTWLRQRFHNLPLHQFCYNDTSSLNTITLNHFLQLHTSMLTVTDAMLMTPLHILCCNPTATTEMIQVLQAAQPDAASMRNVMNKTPLMMLLESKSSKYNVFHDDGQLLPLVGLLEQGLDMDALDMIRAFDDDMALVSELENIDDVSGLLPFMHGASLSTCTLEIMYDLAMERVDLLLDF
jgi:hypothetical protein